MLGILGLVVGLVAVVLGLVMGWMAGGFQRPGRRVETIVELSTSSPSGGPDELCVLCWNIAWGYGWGSEGTGKARPRTHFDRGLQHIAQTIRSTRANVAVLQEVDFDATRSHHIDQARRIAELAGLRYVAYAHCWRARWIPFPGWRPADHFGRMRGGAAVLSAMPLTDNIVDTFEKPRSNPSWYNLFYPFRYLQTVDLVLGSRRLRLYNVHLEAFHMPTREAQAARLVELVSRHRGPCILGGDFNSVPADAPLRAGYPDEPGTSHESDRTLGYIASVPGLVDPLERVTAERTFTFPAHAPNRRLDYLRIPATAEVREARVVHEAGDVSDHLPLLVRFRWPIRTS